MVPIPVSLTPLHFVYLAGVITILTVMILKKDTPAICIAFLFLFGCVGLGSAAGGVMTVFRGMLYASKEFMEVMAAIALVTALSLCLKDLGSDRLMMVPMSRVMGSPGVAWWVLGFSMLLFSLFLWPSPSAALIGAIMLPFALKTGLNPLMAAMAMNLFGHGMALSYDFIIQGAPGISAKAAEITAPEIITQAMPVFLAMWVVTGTAAFWINRREILENAGGREIVQAAGSKQDDNRQAPDTHTCTVAEPSGSVSGRAALIFAWLTPAAFLADVLLLFCLKLSGGQATSLVGGTAILMTCFGAVLGFGREFPEKVTGYLTEGFHFAIRIFAPVIAIGAFFFLGGSGISDILGRPFQSGILNDWALWLSGHAPMTKYAAAAVQLGVGALTGLDGSGFSGLPLTGSLARTFGTAVGGSVPVLAALGQIGAVFVGGGTIVPWGLIPVAAICQVSPLSLARRNLVPVFLGFLAAFLVACLLL